MFTSFASSLSALSAQTIAVDVVGNNLANVNTPGFKASTVYFRDLVSQSMGSSGGGTQVGLGVGRPITIRNFTQGSIQSSGRALDAGVQGEGFFIVRNSQDATLYTRAGNFQVDLQGNLLTATGERVQGWTAIDPTTGAVNTSGAISGIKMAGTSLKPPQASTKFSADLNLDASAKADATSAWSTPIEVFDSLGATHVLTVNFTKTGSNAWQYDISMPGAEATGGTAGAPYAIPGATGALTFGPDGKLADPAEGTAVGFDITDLASGASPMHLTWDLYNGTQGRITQFGQASAASANDQDGSAAAQLLSVGVADGGLIMAQYSNGTQLAVGQVALAAILNPESMTGAGDNNFQVTANTATPVVGVAGTGGRGKIVGGATEYSTVDIAKEFTTLIVLQRSYQANSRVVTTVDELSQETINLKR